MLPSAGSPPAGRVNEYTMATYLIVLGGATALSLVATALAIRLAPRIGAMDAPGVRKVHAAPVPRIGGLAIFLAVGVAALAGVAFDGATRGAVRGDLLRYAGLLCAGALVFAVGLADDIRGIRVKRPVMNELAMHRCRHQ